MKKFIFYTIGLLTTVIMSAQVGTWKGELEVQGMKIPLVFHIEENNGNYIATMDSPQQGAMGIPVKGAKVDGNSVVLDMSDMGIMYEAKVSGETMEGTFKQSGMELPLTLKKGENTLPGDTSLPSSDEVLQQMAAMDTGTYKYKIEDYFAKPMASEFQLSPNGKYMSYREKDKNLKNHLYVKDIKSGKVTKVLEEKDELIRGYGWLNEEMLAYVMDKGGDENYHIYSVKIDGTGNKDLTPFEGVQAQFLALLKEDKDHIIIGMNKNNVQVFEPYKLNVVTGKLEQLYENTDIENPITGYEFDKDGNLRGYTKLVNGIENQLFYSKDGGKNYEVIQSNNWKETFWIIQFNYATDYEHDAYVLSDLDTDKAVIQLYDLKENKPIKTVFANNTYDAGGLRTSRKRNYEVDYYSYTGDKREIVPVSKYYSKLHNRIEKEFPNYEYGIVDYTDDESKYLVIIDSDKLYGKYYTYDADKEEFTFLYDLMPQLKEQDMASMRPITFTSRDGLTIHGYITLPKEAEAGKKVPVIVNPHGGPQGIRDEWGFNPEAQLFASRGYATLQVNFRISGGYGKEFLQAGYGQIGRKCMDDVEDGIQYVIQQGWVDANKVGIYGGSHGGYAVLRGMTKTPDLYACGVDYVGVSNVFTFFDSFPPYWEPYREMVKEIWYDVDNESLKTLIEEVSPVYNIDKIKKPLFVVQGANDPRVNIDESDQIVKALREKGYDVPYMVKYDEGHGFGKEENRIEFYKAMMGFLAKNLKK